MANAANLRIGAVTVTWGGANIGHSKGGVRMTIERDLEDLVTDQWGSSPYDKAIKGQRMQIVVPLAEIDVSHLSTALAEAKLRGSTDQRLDIGQIAGTLLRQFAKQLVLHPVNKAASDTSLDVTVYKAVPVDNVETNFEVENQQIIEVTFEALVDETYGTDRLFGHIGKATVS